MNRKVVLLLAVLGVLVLLCMGCTVASVGGLWWSSRPPKAVTVRLDYPPEVQIGEAFHLVVWVRNQATRPRVLDSIDLDWSWAQHFIVLSTQPAPTKVAEHADLGFVSYFFNAQLPPQEEVPITFTLQGKRNGTFSGNVDVCIDSSIRCVSVPLSICVVP